MEFSGPPLGSLSWETICQNIVETIGIALDADIAIICAQKNLDHKPQCFYYQAALKYCPKIDDETLQKTVPFINDLLVLNNIEERPRSANLSRQTAFTLAGGQVLLWNQDNRPSRSAEQEPRIDFNQRFNNAEFFSSEHLEKPRTNPVRLDLSFPEQERDFDNDCPIQVQYSVTSAIYDICQQIAVKSSLSIPLTDQTNLKATLTLHRCQPESSWQPEEIKLAGKMATQAGLAIAQIEAYENMRKVAQREATLNRITNAIRSSLEPQVMFNAIVSELGSALQVDGCSLSLWTKRDRFMRCVAFYNPQEPRSSGTTKSQNSTISLVQIADNPVLQKLLQERKPLVFQDLAARQELARHDLPWRAKSKALLIVPLILNGEIMGSLTLRQSALSRHWEESDIQLAQAVATQAAIALKQARLYDTTRKQAEQLQISQQKVAELNHYLTESVLKRFLPEAIANKAAAGQLALDLNPELQCITVLFCDLVGFTHLSSELEVNLLSELLNEYLEVMSQAVFEQGGTIDKFLGDAVMALFGAPEALSAVEQAQRAIATAQAMYHNLQPLNQKWQAQGIGVDDNLPSLQLRCGIHQGTAVVGMFGGQQRKDYTAIGQVVNIAARLQKHAVPNSILVSETVLNNLVFPEAQQIQPQYLKLKGIKPDFPAYSIPID